MKNCTYCQLPVEENDSYKAKPGVHKRCWKSRTYQLKLKVLYEYMLKHTGGKCSRCGYDEYLGALCFHHKDPLQKDRTWRKQWAKEKLYKELDKCEILCMNCHAKVHADMAEYDHWSEVIKKFAPIA